MRIQIKEKEDLIKFINPEWDEEYDFSDFSFAFDGLMDSYVPDWETLKVALEIVQEIEFKNEIVEYSIINKIGDLKIRDNIANIICSYFYKNIELAKKCFDENWSKWFLNSNKKF